MHHEAERDREREAAEMFYGGARDALAWAPYASATWLAARALLPCLEDRLATLGWQPERQPEEPLR